ncbi:ABCB family ABC transporter ATP-binding protein/permease [Halioxenophilus aromaticivorans]|uniref:ABC transporter ATP-binding protein/permease n=1 Tax=Halioxenophilus aromaticivorans TaxID=1306992 RepID=A0AAV3U4L4_9ALTE
MRPSSHGGDYAPQHFNWQVLTAIWPYLAAYKLRIGLALLCLMAAKLASTYIPFLLKYMVDTLDTSTNGNANLVLMPLALVVAYGAARFANVLFGELRDTVFGRVTEQAMRRIGLKVFRHLHQLDLAFHLDRRTGALSRDIERGTNGISFLMRFFVFNIIPTIFEIVLIAGILFVNYGWLYALVTLAAVAAYAVFTFYTTEWRTRFMREANAADNSANARAVDSLLNFETVKYFNNEGFEADRYDQDLIGWAQARRKNRLSLFTLNGGQALIIAVSQTLMIGMAANAVTQGDMTLGDFTLINAFMMQLFLPLNFLGFVYREIKASLANIEQMFALLDEKPTVIDTPDAPTLNTHQGRVEFDKLWFSYSPDRPILKGVSFAIEPGQKVAVVGASGAGKSTLVKLLFRFYDPQKGQIRIDGQDIQAVTQSSLRQHIGIVPQDTVLFNDTILENIRYGNPMATDTEVNQAIKLAHLSDFINNLPKGANTMVGERGLKLSGGEKQRVAIARTLLKNALILAFDEATSSLDSHSEQAILQALEEIAQGHSSLVIAHRLSTIVDADNIVVLNAGEVVEQGNHTALLALNGHYAKLWQSQQKQATASD